MVLMSVTLRTISRVVVGYKKPWKFIHRREAPDPFCKSKYVSVYHL